MTHILKRYHAEESFYQNTIPHYYILIFDTSFLYIHSSLCAVYVIKSIILLYVSVIENACCLTLKAVAKVKEGESSGHKYILMPRYGKMDE